MLLVVCFFLACFRSVFLDFVLILMLFFSTDTKTIFPAVDQTTVAGQGAQVECIEDESRQEDSPVLECSSRREEDSVGGGGGGTSNPRGRRGRKTYHPVSV